MATKFIPLDEAARTLNVPTERLVEMIKAGDVRGFRDGASWKIPENELQRIIADGGVDVLDELPLGGSSILVSEQGVGSSIKTSGSNIIGGDKKSASDDDVAGSDVDLGSEIGEGSDLMLISGEGDGGSDVRLVPSGQTPGPMAGGSGLQAALSDELALEPLASDELLKSLNSPPTSTGALEFSDEEGMNSEYPTDASSNAQGPRQDFVLSELDLLGKKGGSGLLKGDSGDSLLGGSNILSSSSNATPSTPIHDSGIDDSDLAIAEDDDLVLGGSDLALAGDSGLNLMSPSDSGISLESEPLDLAGSSISALDLATDATPSGSGGSRSGSGSGSLVDFRADEEFNLSPSGISIDADEESGSQVIEVEDSVESFDSGVGSGVGLEDAVLDAAGFDDFGTAGAGGMGDEADMGAVVEDTMAAEETSEATQAAGVAMVPAYEVPFSIWNVLALLPVLLLLCLGGMVMTDLVRNLADHAGPTTQVNSLTDALLGMFGLNS